MLRRMELMFRIGEWGSSYPTEGLAFAVCVESMYYDGDGRCWRCSMARRMRLFLNLYTVR
jgi:hypothetical protein